MKPVFSPMRISAGLMMKMAVAIVSIRVCIDVSGAPHCVGATVSTG